VALDGDRPLRQLHHAQAVAQSHPGEGVGADAGRSGLAARVLAPPLQLRLAFGLRDLFRLRGPFCMASADKADHAGQCCHRVVFDPDMAVGLEVRHDRGAEPGAWPICSQPRSDPAFRQMSGSE
jgi:hypothetical protein